MALSGTLELDYTVTRPEGSARATAMLSQAVTCPTAPARRGPDPDLRAEKFHRRPNPPRVSPTWAATP